MGRKSLPPRTEEQRRRDAKMSEKLRAAGDAFDALPREEQEKILRKQQKSWARQDRD